ncbi:hypothetical protein A2642_01395 [Candidatus Nomurabacteria bacterium RIFCSPHIGHO2_01_FULL_39_10]|uniref:Uncharacterized protein n=1 Tax=Candidatus Nomurabacteria bacterium RIFCSPHIGHO2_01_FULL_39_10 TaxID=1801733 RepID=A0A1F6V9Q8_9BACT|nr:MAG: hypothetical protein A2642_01395 [Candidatus Nomurabacteria bacterium RIFCSPHIGHO2_01_FULL_39_10]
MVTEYKVTAQFTIESSEMTHVGGNTTQVKVADQSLDVLLDSLEQKGIIIDKECSEKRIVYLFLGRLREELVPFSANHPNEKIIGYNLHASEMEIIVSEYDHSRSLGGPGVIGGPAEYVYGIHVDMKYVGNTLKGVEEKCKKVEEVFEGLYDPIVRAMNEKLAAMTPDERQKYERKMKRLGRELMSGEGKKFPKTKPIEIKDGRFV